MKIICFRPTSDNGINIKKESVEMFVYLTIGIWRGLDENKQYSTPVQYGVSTERADITYQYK